MSSKKPRPTTAAEWELERIQMLVKKVMAIITSGAGMAAAEPHLTQARASLLRAFAGQEQNPVVQGLLERLDAMRETMNVNTKGESK